MLKCLHRCLYALSPSPGGDVVVFAKLSLALSPLARARSSHFFPPGCDKPFPCPKLSPLPLASRTKKGLSWRVQPWPDPWCPVCYICIGASERLEHCSARKTDKWMDPFWWFYGPDSLFSSCPSLARRHDYRRRGGGPFVVLVSRGLRWEKDDAIGARKGSPTNIQQKAAFTEQILLPDALINPLDCSRLVEKGRNSGVRKQDDAACSLMERSVCTNKTDRLSFAIIMLTCLFDEEFNYFFISFAVLASVPRRAGVERSHCHIPAQWGSRSLPFDRFCGPLVDPFELSFSLLPWSVEMINDFQTLFWYGILFLLSLLYQGSFSLSLCKINVLRASIVFPLYNFIHYSDCIKWFPL